MWFWPKEILFFHIITSYFFTVFRFIDVQCYPTTFVFILVSPTQYLPIKTCIPVSAIPLIPIMYSLTSCTYSSSSSVLVPSLLAFIYKHFSCFPQTSSSFLTSVCTVLSLTNYYSNQFLYFLCPYCPYFYLVVFHCLLLHLNLADFPALMYWNQAWRFH